MKKLSLIAIFIFKIVILNAQSPFVFGLKTGLNISDFSKHEYANNKLGYNIGMTVEYKLPNNFYLFSGLELTTKGAKYNELFYENNYGSSAYGYGDGAIEYIRYFKIKSKMNAVYFQIPVSFGYKVEIATNIKVIFRVGPYISYGIGGKYKIDCSYVDSKGNFLESAKESNYDADFFNKGTQKSDMGINIGTGIEFKKISMEFGCEHGVTKIWKAIGSKNRNIYINMGYKF